VREFQEKRKIKKILYSKVTILLLFVASVFLAVSDYKVYVKSRQARELNQAANMEEAGLREKIEGLEGDINHLGTQAGEEEEIRKKFNVKKPGERVLVVVERSNENDTSGAVAPSGILGRVWYRIKNLFH